MNDAVSAAAGNPGPNRAAFPATAAPRVPDHELLRCIGRGSYGEVWLARNTMGTYRAVKVVYRDSFQDARPFERELSGIQKFEPVSRLHDGLVDILQVGRNNEAGYFYYVMELADDADSSARSAILAPESYVPRTLGHELSSRGRLPSEECLPLFLSLTSGLSHLHQQGLIHRDIKPSNIIFVSGVPKLADIGLVSEAGESDSYVGTEGYIPPEGPGTPQADIYSLGKLFYEVSTGQDRTRFPALPIEPDSIVANRGLLELNAVFIRACANDVRDRYASADEMHADLALLQSGKSIRRLRTIERRLVKATRAGLAAACLFCVAISAYLFTHHQAHVARENFRNAEIQRRRAERAEQNALDQLCGSYLAEARAIRRSGQAGHRIRSLGAISKAVAIANPVDTPLALDLRNEAIAALALTDLRAIDVSTQTVDTPFWLPFDPTIERYLDADAADGSVSIRRVSDHEELGRLPGLTHSKIMGTEFSPDGHLVSVVTEDQGYSIWDLKRNKQVLTGSPDPAASFWEFTPDSRSLAIVYTNGSLVIRDIDGGATNRVLQLPGVPRLFTFRPDGAAFASWNRNNHQIEIRSLTSTELLRSWAVPFLVLDIAWSPSGQRLATAGSDRNCHVWDCASETNACIQTLRGHASVVTRVGFLRSDDVLASRSWDSTLRLWDIVHGAQLLEAHGAAGAFKFDRGTRRLGVLQDRGSKSELRLFEVLGGEVVREFWEQTDPMLNGPWTLSFSPEGRWLASGSADGFRVWSLRTGREVSRQPGPVVRRISFHGRGTLITSSPQQLLKWSLESANEDELVVGAPQLLAPMATAERFLDALPTRRGCVFASTQDGPILGFHEGTNFLSMDNSERSYFLATSPDGQWLAAGGSKTPGVRLWKTTNSQLIREFPTTAGADVGFSPDNRWLVTGSTDEFRLWELPGGTPGPRISREQNPGLVGHAAFRPDGKLMAITVSQWSIALVDPLTGRELARLEHPDPQMISQLAFSPSGTQLAASTEGHAIQLWDLQQLRRELAVLNLDWTDPR